MNICTECKCECFPIAKSENVNYDDIDESTEMVSDCCEAEIEEQ